MLSVHDLTVRYGSVFGVRNLSIEVASGEFVSIVGANGAGKSTLLNAIAGVVPASEGSIAFDGLPLDGAPSEERARRGIALVPEDRGIFRSMTVAENLRLATAAGRTGDLRAALGQVFDLFPPLAELRHQQAGQLSGGEQQMLAIGRSLVARPSLLLLDEPSLGLAPILVGQVLASVAELNRRGVTVVLVEQHAVKAIAAARRTYVLANGRVALEGTRDELLGNKRSVVEVYLGGQPDLAAPEVAAP